MTTKTPSDWQTNTELRQHVSWPKDRRYKPRSSSRWLSPPQLIIAAYRQLVAGTFESFSDRRDSLATRPKVMFAHPDVAESLEDDSDDAGQSSLDRPRVEPLFPNDPPHADRSGFWFDYVADLGDGFSATYSVAEEIALTHEWDKKKEYETEDGRWETLERGDLLVMGGDEVYPLASDTEYRNRTVGPYETACRHQERGMSLLAVPGNHDWYDGLTAFLSRFCSNQWIGGWNTRQTRSYWAAKVQPGWWIWGVDLALEHTPIDYHQLAYFEAVAAALEPEDRIILVTPKPAWLRERKAWIGGGSPKEESYNPDYNELAYFMNRALQAWKLANGDVASSTDEHEYPQFAMVLAGDKHCYSRYDNTAFRTAEAALSKAEVDAAQMQLQEAQVAVAATTPAESAAKSGDTAQSSRLPIDKVEDDFARAADKFENPTRRFPHILCGGGGAYLSLPFHHAETIAVPNWRDSDVTPLDLEKQWPERPETNRIAVKSLWRIVLRNWGFGVLIGAVYLLFAFTVEKADPVAFDTSWFDHIVRAVTAIGNSWWTRLLTVGVIFGLQARSAIGPIPRYAMAAAQTAIHIVAIAGCDAIARWAQGSGGGQSDSRWTAIVLLAYALSWAAWGFHRWMFNGRAPRHTLLAPALFGVAVYVFIAEPGIGTWLIPMLGVSSIIGAVVFAANLLISAYTFGDMQNMVSVAVRETGWKSFLRVHIEGDNCRVWAIGLQKVPHQRLLFRTDGVENYDAAKFSAEPAKYTPEVTPIYGGMLGTGKDGYDARIIDSWTVHRHDNKPPTVVDVSEPAAQNVPSEVQV